MITNTSFVQGRFSGMPPRKSSGISETHTGENPVSGQAIVSFSFTFEAFPFPDFALCKDALSESG
jgi:hypothetical protein